MSSNFTHKELCVLARKWLYRPNSQGGHGCNVALTECRSGYRGETPDAIGFRAQSAEIESILVEVKTSRADFLADAKKPHRSQGEGLGMWRYFLCPEGVIRQEDLPAGWGLLYAKGKNQIKPIVGPAAVATNYGKFQASLAQWRQQNDSKREMWLLVRVMARIQDPDLVKSALNESIRERERLARLCDTQAKELRKHKLDLFNKKSSPVLFQR